MSLSLPTAVSATTPTGAQVYASKCAACHQDDGAGSESLRTPAIAGLDAAYVRRQLTHLLDGKRSAAEQPFAQAMVAILKTLGSKELDAVAAHVTSLPKVKISQKLPPVGFRARGLYSGCSSCHGPSGEGVSQLGAPRIGGQYRWYVQAQLQRYRDGRRGHHPGDIRGQQMRAMAVAIASDADVDVLANYVAGLEP